jgi:hypothetical protein
VALQPTSPASLTRRDATKSAARSAPRPTQPPLPASPQTDRAGARQRALKLCLATLRQAGPLTASELEGRLQWLDDAIDQRLIEQVLGQEGAAHVRCDDASGRYAPRHGRDIRRR